MTADDAIAFLNLHQPMPSDFEITDEEGGIYAAILKHFEARPDSRCIPLLIRSVSAETGLGMYEHIKFVLLQHRREEIVPHLRDVLRSGTDAQKTRCCWWAADIGAWDLSAEIESLCNSTDEDLRDAANAFIELRK